MPAIPGLPAVVVSTSSPPAPAGQPGGRSQGVVETAGAGGEAGGLHDGGLLGHGGAHRAADRRRVLGGRIDDQGDRHRPPFTQGGVVARRHDHAALDSLERQRLAGGGRGGVAGRDDDGGGHVAGPGQPLGLLPVLHRPDGHDLAQPRVTEHVVDERPRQLAAVFVDHGEGGVEVDPRPAEGQADEAGEDQRGEDADDVRGPVPEPLAQVLAGDDQGGAHVSPSGPCP
jgi:hypothetical protein